jgi:hypothetical protein
VTPCSHSRSGRRLSPAIELACLAAGLTLLLGIGVLEQGPGMSTIASTAALVVAPVSLILVALRGRYSGRAAARRIGEVNKAAPGGMNNGLSARDDDDLTVRLEEKAEAGTKFAGDEFGARRLTSRQTHTSRRRNGMRKTLAAVVAATATLAFAGTAAADTPAATSVLGWCPDGTTLIGNNGNPIPPGDLTAHNNAALGLPIDYVLGASPDPWTSLAATQGYWASGGTYSRWAFAGFPGAGLSPDELHTIYTNGADLQGGAPITCSGWTAATSW